MIAAANDGGYNFANTFRATFSLSFVSPRAPNASGVKDLALVAPAERRPTNNRRRELVGRDSVEPGLKR